MIVETLTANYHRDNDDVNDDDNDIVRPLKRERELSRKVKTLWLGDWQ